MVDSKRLILRRGEGRRLAAGHLWAFSNEVKEILGDPAAGDVVDLFDAGGGFLGRGFFNPHSLIAFRMLTREDRPVDASFWEERLRDAEDFRRSFLPDTEACRVVFGESDLLPGLVVDRYGGYLAVQFLSAGLEKRRAEVVAALNAVFSPRGIIARNDSALRRLEGLEETVEVLAGEVPERVVITENGLRFKVDTAGGQKTGFFFDQRENRAVFGSRCRERTVLDAFCHTGGFGMNALAGGARSVTFLDASQHALDLVGENAGLNGFGGRPALVRADAMEYLSSGRLRGAFDVINLDPPALIRNRKHIPAGYKAYRKINALALSLLGPGGMLATSSCSHHLSPEAFRSMLRESAARAGRQVRIVETRSQAKDHPVLLSMPETEYLKFSLLEVL